MELKKEIEEKLRQSLFELEKNWKLLFSDVSTKDYMWSILNRCLGKISKDLVSKGVNKQCITQNGIDEYIRPKVTNILRCFSYASPQDIKVILLGEDPYSTKDMADGLSFSFTGMVKNSSLKNIFACLKKSGLIEEIPEYVPGLGYYASQGVLLLNKNLTRTPEITAKDSTVYVSSTGTKNNRNNHDFWEDFTTSVIKYLIELHKERGLAFLVLGSKHDKIVKMIAEYNLPEKLLVLNWSHPSPMSPINNNPENPKHFEQCPHFVGINNFLAETDQEIINWDPNTDYRLPKRLRYLAFASDGGCKNNVVPGTINPQKIDIGASAAYFPNIIKREKNSHSGMYSSHIFAYRYVYNEEKMSIDIDTTEQIGVNNDRAEILAACMGLLEIYKYLEQHVSNDEYIIYIIVDNMHVFNLINNYEKIPKSTDGRRDLDLEIILSVLMTKISQILGDDIIDQSRKTHITNPNDIKYDLNRIGITTIHQPSHGKAEDYKNFRREMFDLNHTVDAEVNKLISEYNSR